MALIYVKFWNSYFQLRFTLKVSDGVHPLLARVSGDWFSAGIRDNHNACSTVLHVSLIDGEWGGLMQPLPQEL